MSATDPVLQAILALCSHPKYVAGCHSCDVRRVEAAEHLAAMAQRALDALPDDRRP